MDGIVYHSSQMEGLTELDPSKSKHQGTHGKKFLYATSSKELAMFMSARITDLYSAASGQGTAENPAILVERLPGIFDKFLHRPTTIYSLDAQDFYQGTQWEGEVVTEKKQKVLSEENISDVYSELKKSEETGTVKMYHYPDRPPEIPKDNSDLIEHMMLPIYRATGDFGIVKTMLRTYPKLFPKIMKNLTAELFSNVTKKIRNRFQPANKEELLSSGEEKDCTPKSNPFKESLKKGAPSLEAQAEYVAAIAQTQNRNNEPEIANEGPEID